MNTIPAQEIKRRGIAAVDDLFKTEDVHISSKTNSPSTWWIQRRDTAS